MEKPCFGTTSCAVPCGGFAVARPAPWSDIPPPPGLNPPARSSLLFAGGQRTQARGRNSNNEDAPFEDETEELMRNDIDAPVDDEEEDGEELIGDAMEA